MVVHSTGVQWPAPHQGPHLLICGSPLPGKYAGGSLAGRTRGEGRPEAAGEIVGFAITRGSPDHMRNVYSEIGRRKERRESNPTSAPAHSKPRRVQKLISLMFEESPRKSLVKGERFVRHDDTSERAEPR